LVVYWSTRATAPTEWDSVQLTLGFDRFDVRQDSPHAPGYWAYIAADRLIRALTPLDGTASLALASERARLRSGAPRRGRGGARARGRLPPDVAHRVVPKRVRGRVACESRPARMAAVGRDRRGGKLTADMVAAFGAVALLGAIGLVVAIRKRDTRARPAAFRRFELLFVAIVPPVLFVSLFHFGKAGYLAAFLLAAFLLALWPVARLRPKWRTVGVVGVALVSLFGTQPFLFGAGGLPDALVDRGPWFTRRLNRAPFGGTRDVLRVSDRYQAVFDPERDVIVYVNGNGGQWFRHAMYGRCRSSRWTRTTAAML